MSYTIELHFNRYFPTLSNKVIVDKIMQDIFNPLFAPSVKTGKTERLRNKININSQFSLPAKSMTVNTQENVYYFWQKKPATSYKLPIELLPEYLFDTFDDKDAIYESLMDTMSSTTFYVSELRVHVGLIKSRHNVLLTNAIMLIPYHDAHKNVSVRKILLKRLPFVKRLSIYNVVKQEFIDDITLQELEQIFINEYKLHFLKKESIKVLSLVFGNPSLLFYQTIHIPDYIVAMHLLEYLHPKKIFSF